MISYFILIKMIFLEIIFSVKFGFSPNYFGEKAVKTGEKSV